MAGHLILACPLYGFNENWDRCPTVPVSPAPASSPHARCISRITDFRLEARISLWGEESLSAPRRSYGFNSETVQRVYEHFKGDFMKSGVETAGKSGQQLMQRG